MFKPLTPALLALTTFTAPTMSQAQGFAFEPPAISEALTIDQKELSVLNSTMTYLEQGTGDTVLFLHGNPSSSYLWRNVIPYVSDTHRTIAPDLIGMGHSGKPDIAYTYADHAKYLDAFIAELDLTDLTLVVHDWGAALGWDYARRNPEKVKRIAFMEGVLPPAFPQPSYEAMGPEFGGMFQALQDPVQGEEMIMKNNMFVEQILPSAVIRPLGATAKSTYGAPYSQEASRLPTWMWPREVPIGGKPESSVTLMGQLQSFMGETDMPVLLAYAEPGALVPPMAVPYYEGLIQNLETAYVGHGIHFIQEDQPVAIGRAISDWLRRN